MNSKCFFIVLLILSGTIIFGFSVKQRQAVSKNNNTNTKVISSLQPQSKNMGVVEVKLTPETVDSGRNIIFNLAMNNHSIDLNYDYKKIVTLLDDQDNEYKPSEWTGNTSGHHISGKLIFLPTQTKTTSLTIKLDGVDNETENFSWQF